MHLQSNASHPITFHSQQSRCSNVKEKELIERRYEWSSVHEAYSGISPFSRMEGEIRRLNDTLTHQDPKGNHIFSILGLITEMVTLLADNKECKVETSQQEKLSNHGEITCF
jgi:hypothetical protein